MHMAGGKAITLEYILLLLHRLPKLPSQCYLNLLGKLDNLGSNEEYRF